MIVFKPRFVEPANELKVKTPVLKLKETMKRAIMSITVIIMISATTAYTQESLSASGIMQHSRQAMTTSAFEGVSVLTITDSRGRTRERTNVTASKSYPDGTEKRIIRFVSPPDVEGTTVLIWDHDSGEDEMWIYLLFSGRRGE
ncbi:MAG: outer membrane lipoprotein-sorting protein [Bacteroidales bacterium]